MHIEFRQRGCELQREAAAQFDLDRARHAQQPQPKPQLLLAAGFGSARSARTGHTSPPDTEMA